MTTEQHSEIERKYDVSADCVVPDLATLAGVSAVAPPVQFDQVSTYFDTPGLRLLSAHITLRRRTGGPDDGWHLKLPGTGDRREEVRLPPGQANGQVPEELLELVRIHVRDTALIPAAVITNRRLTHRLLDDQGHVLAELCDDHVRAETSSTAPTVEEWREWELELVDGPPELLDAAEPLLLAAGALPALEASKLSRVLSERLPVRPAWRRHEGVGRRSSAAQLLSAYLAHQLGRLALQDQRLRSGDEEGVHQLRVAARRLRSALATYDPILEPGAGTGLRTELKWLGGTLSAARDAQVLRGRLGALAREQPPALLLGPVVSRIDDELREQLRSGRSKAVEALGGARYFRLLDQLEGFLDDPPLRDQAGASARSLVPELLRSDLARLHKRHRAVEAAADPDRLNLALHEVRKAAKRLRYAAETAEPVFGKRATRLASRAEALQELLGEHQDTVVSRLMLRVIGVRAHLAGENGFTFGRLHALEEARALRLEEEYPSVLAGLPSAKDLRAWSGR